ncbi:Armadillo repeat-containing protein 7 [Danaus plexippus plexippus]|uniref:Armadillo repeat-containing protein 7 n=1 Tax=Danaus plexippus plexippus TaxID=278856 RepID=A0A212EXM9_DANPL|nr:Armadillo repeat-containing protein 7 [Danaus plexippus plexippus]
MFSSKTQLRKRTPENGTDRESYLSLLVDEYINSSSFDAKHQVLANLANFAYDPINYGFIRNVGVLDIFIHVLKNANNSKLLHFATAGICNLCIDPDNVDYIVNNGAIEPISTLLNSDHEETLADAITIFIYLYDSHAKDKIHDIKTVKNIEALIKSENQKICKFQSTFSRAAFKAGDKIRIQKTLTQKDLDTFSNLTSDHNYLHKNNGNKRPIVHGAFLNGLVAGLIGTHLPGPGTVLVSQTMKFPNKCFVGEKLTISVELVDVRKILKVKFFCIVEEEKKVVFEGEAKLMLAKDC